MTATASNGTKLNRSCSPDATRLSRSAYPSHLARPPSARKIDARAARRFVEAGPSERCLLRASVDLMPSRWPTSAEPLKLARSSTKLTKQRCFKPQVIPNASWRARQSAVRGSPGRWRWLVFGVDTKIVVAENGQRLDHMTDADTREAARR